VDDMTLETTIRDLTGRLAEVETQCRLITNAVHDFDSLIKSHGLNIKIKLEILRDWIISSEEEVYLKHQNQGYVWISRTKENGITMQWFNENEEFIKKASYKSWGKTAFSSSELIEVILRLEQEVTEGRWANAIAWLNLYGKSPGRDFRKLPALPVATNFNKPK